MQPLSVDPSAHRPAHRLDETPAPIWAELELAPGETRVLDLH